MLQPVGPLDCRDVEAWLHVYLDGEASAEDRALLEAHLRGCVSCTSRAELYERTRRALREAALVEDAEALPEGLEARVRRGLQSADRPKRTFAFLRVAPFAAAGLAMGVAAIAFLGDAPPSASLEAPEVAVVRRTVEQHTLDVPVDVASPDASYVARFLKPRVGAELQVPRLDVRGYGLAGGRVISLEDRRAAQLVYKGGLGRRLSVMAVPDPDGKLAAQLRRSAASTTSNTAASTASLDPAVLYRGEAGGLFVQVLAHDGIVYSMVGEREETARLDLASSLGR